MKSLINIPKENLAFYCSEVKKKDSYENPKIVSFMPFDITEISGLSNDDKWDRLTELSVAYLRDVTKEIPSFAKEQDYEMSGGAGYISAESLITKIEELDSQTNQVEIKPIKTFNNAFDKIVLPTGYREKIIETVSQLKDYKTIFEEWGLGEKVKRGKGVNILLSGASGTGKTWCGEVIAEYLNTNADIVSVATIESKWTGESEQNVNRIFKSLQGANKVLILDEVDSFISSRSSSDHQHYSKLTNQFLIELERHNGICVMTTNRPVKLDKALGRRIDLILDFPFPNKEARKQIWTYLVPEKMPTTKLDYDKLSEYEINGGLIKNALFSAARKAVTRKEKVSMAILIESIKEEIRESESLSNGKDHS